MGEKAHVTIIVSGYRKKNTWNMVKSFEAGALEAGHEVEFFHVKDLKISPCTGCEYCFKTGECIIHDDMYRIYPALEKTDILVLATPIYFFTFSSDLKKVLDRFQPFWSSKYVMKDTSKRKKLKVFFLSNHGGPYQNDAYFATHLPLKTICSSLKADYHANYFVSATDKHPVEEQIDVMAELHMWGSNCTTVPRKTIHR